MSLVFKTDSLIESKNKFTKTFQICIVLEASVNHDDFISKVILLKSDYSDVHLTKLLSDWLDDMNLRWCDSYNIYDKNIAIEILVTNIRRDHRHHKRVEYYPGELMNEKINDYLYPESFRVTLLTGESILS